MSRCSILIFAFVCPLFIESIPQGWQSSMNLSSPGFLFSPVDPFALSLVNLTRRSLMACAQSCHSNGQCRIFDYDPPSADCRLFQGDLLTMDSLVPSSSSSRVGSLKLDASLFLTRGQPCSACRDNRYLQCSNNTCQCPWQTYFDGSICRSEKLLDEACLNTTECRSDLNYVCLSQLQCGRES